MTVNLEELARALSAGEEHLSNIPAGYTYLGQMISHDLVRPTRSNHLTRNFDAKLNFESLFGSTFSGFPAVDENREWDLPRNPDGSAQIPDPRNDENVVIAQMHRLWQRVYENIVREGAGQDAAKADVILLFQAVVIDDYLRRVLQPHIFQGCFRRGERHLVLNESAVPELFSRAAFRFGHSMVRRTYTLNKDSRGIELFRLFLANSRIPDKFKVSWSEFFEVDPDKTPQSAMGIDTTITAFMNVVPGQNDTRHEVILRDLEAGSELPKGVMYVSNLLNGSTLGDDQYPKIDPALQLHHAANSSVQVLGLSGDHLPMFPYLLLESELHGQRERLGVLGSLIVGETIQNAIRTASTSVFQDGVYRFELVWKRLSSACRSVVLAVRPGGSSSRISIPKSIDMPAIISIANLT